MGPSETVQRDLILGIVDNYTIYEISLFLLSLRRTSFEGHLCLFVGPNMGAGTTAWLRRRGAEVIAYTQAFPFVPNPHPNNVRHLPDPIHIYNFRHFLYLDYLLKHRGQFRNVLITDVRDVVFQKDPFDFASEDCIHVAIENTDVRVGACTWTSDWVIRGFGTAALDKVRHSEMSCAGTTIAPVEHMERYLRTLLGMIQQMDDAYESADQAAHNLLLHDGSLEPVKRFYNFRGPMLTVGTEPEYRFNTDGELVNDDGSVINIVHQYDRHVELARFFQRKVRPSPLQRLAARVGHRIQRYSTRLMAMRAGS